MFPLSFSTKNFRKGENRKKKAHLRLDLLQVVIGSNTLVSSPKNGHRSGRPRTISCCRRRCSPENEGERRTGRSSEEEGGEPDEEGWNGGGRAHHRRCWPPSSSSVAGVERKRKKVMFQVCVNEGDVGEVTCVEPHEE